MDKTFNLNFRVFFIYCLHSAVIIECTYFRGGTISWSSDINKTVTFHTRMAFQYGANGCHGNNMDALVTNLQTDKWTCTSGCVDTVTVGDNSYHCIATDSTENWEQGENRFTHNMSAYNQTTIGYAGGNWMSLGYGAGGQWYIGTTLDLGVRSDTGTQNNSPVTASFPIYRLPQGCTSTVSIPVHDVDGDTVLCRWATVIECGDACMNTTSGLPGATINPTTCTLTIDANAINGYDIGSYYLVAMTIEDFTSTTLSVDGVTIPTNQALSSVPLQFLVYIDNMTSPCADKPTFTDIPNDGATIIVPRGSTWKPRIYMEGTSGNLPVDLAVSGPRGTIVTELKPDDLGRTNVMYADIEWTPTPEQDGVNIVCFKTQNKARISSEQICYVLLAGYPDPCDSNPCQNNATCSLSMTSYTCTCPSGIIGNNCETDIDECLLSPCQNGGECYNLLGDYKCFCRPGYGGKNCTGPDFCSANPCKGHGTCLHNGTTFVCECYTGYSGLTCELDIDDCLSSPCQNGAECTDLVGGYYCQCPPQFTGQLCETVIDYCDPSPCRNGGRCRTHTDGYICDCPDNVIGLTCEIPIQQVCDGDTSFCSCYVDGEPIRVTIPDPVIDDSYERDLRTGIIGYPVGLLVGVGLCAMFHFLIRPRCVRGNRTLGRPSSSKSTRSWLSTSTTSTIYPERIVPIYPDRVTPPPSYSSLHKRPDIHV